MEKTILFEMDELKELATFVSQLVREGVTFEVNRTPKDKRTCYAVTLTGGY